MDMDDSQILGLLNRINTWWDGNDVPNSLCKAVHRRRDFYKIREKLDDSRQIITVRGPRQVGKTTLCGQLIETLIEDQFVPSECILYLNIENSQFLSNPDNVIRDSLEVYERYILERSFRNIGVPVYVFIDEVQKATDWASTLKYYTDTYSNLQFITTGSVSTLIKEDASETLIGRLDEQIIMPMKYVDHVRYHNVLEEETIYEESTALRDALRNSIEKKDSGEFTVELTRFYGTRQATIPELVSQKDDYLLKGGYPGVLDDNVVDAHTSLDSDLRYTVTADLANVFEVKKPEKVLKVLSLVAESTGGKLNIKNIAETAGVGRDTAKRYLEHLEEFFLVSPCPMYTTSEYQSAGRQKIYLQDVGLYNTLAGIMTTNTLEDGNKMGPILETAVCDHARRLQFYLSNAQNADVAYWDKHGEVDFVLTGPEYVLPIEVKHGDSTQKDLRGLRNFIEESNAEFGLAVNNAEQLKEDGDVIHIPAWLFFFLC